MMIKLNTLMRKAAAKKPMVQNAPVEIKQDASKAVVRAISKAVPPASGKKLIVPRQKVKLVVKRLLGISSGKEKKPEDPFEELVKNPHALKRAAEKYGVSEASIEDIYKRLQRLEEGKGAHLGAEDAMMLRNELASLRAAPDFGRLSDIDEIRQAFSEIEGRLAGESGADKLREAEIERESIIKSKDEIERKYYKREIDEATFKKMMSDYEQQLIKTESKIKAYKAEGITSEPRPSVNMNRVFEKYAKGFKAVYFPAYPQMAVPMAMQPAQQTVQQTQTSELIRPLIAVESRTIISKNVVDGMEIPEPERKISLMETEEPESMMNINVVYPLIPRAPAKGELVYSYTNIKWDPKENGLVYSLFEPALTPEEKRILAKSKELLEERLNIDLRKLRKVEAVNYLMRQTDEVFSVMGVKLDQKRVDVLKYYIRRDFVGLERIDPMMNDPNIEDISCDGTNIPIYIFHRNPLIGSIRTNVKFPDQRSLDTFTVKLAQRAGKAISVAEPLLDGTLPDGSRVQATLGTDIARRGSNFCIKEGYVQMSDGSIEDIKTLFENWKKSNGVSTDEFGNELAVPINSYAAGVHHDSLEQEKGKIIQILKLPPPERLVRVSFAECGKTNSCLEVTENHMFHVLTGAAGIETLESNKLKPGLWVPVPVQIEAEGNLSEEDFLASVLNCLKNSAPGRVYVKIDQKTKQYITYSDSPNKLKDIKRGKTTSMPIAEFLKNLQINRQSIDDVKAVYCILRNGKEGRGAVIRVPLKLTEKLAYLVGWVAGDGSLTKDNISIHTGLNEDYKKSVMGTINELFGINGKTYKNDENRIYINSKILAKLMHEVFEIPYGYKSRKVDAPKIIQKSKNIIVSKFLQGLFEADGSLGSNINLTTFSKNMATKVIFLLSRLGVYSTFNTDGNCHRIYVPSAYYRKFSENVFSNDKIENLVKNQKKTKISNVLPSLFLDNLLKQCKDNGIKSNAISHILHPSEIRKSGKLTFSKIKSLNTLLKSRVENDLTNAVDRLLRGDLEFKRVSKVEVLDNKNGSPVYDISCNPVTFYVGGKDTPLFVHDTIRKFTDVPLTPVDMMNYGTINATALAYLWMAVEQGKSVLIGGSTASGKTTLLNVLSLFIKPTKKIVSIEDSVTGDSEILVNRGGSFEKLPIGKLVDEQIEKYGNEKDVFGTEYCQMNPEGAQVFAMDTEGKIKLCPVRSFVRHRVNKDVLEVTTRAGRRIKVTGDHSLFSLDLNGKIVPVEARNLLKESFIATPRILPHNTGRLESINLFSRVKDLEGVFVEGDGLKHIPMPELVRAGATGYQKNKCVTDGLLPVEIFSRLGNAEEFAGAPDGLSIKAGRGGRGVKAVLKLTDEFLVLVGLWLADGCYDKNSVLISAANDAECKYSIEQAASQLGLGCKYHSDGITYIINSAVLRQAMEKTLGICGGAYTKRVPNWVYNLGIEQISCLLKGYFSGNGSVSKDEIEASSSSIGLIKDIHTLMLRLGIMSRFTTKIKERDKTYRIRISGSENLKLFCEKIGFLQKYKQEKLANRSLVFANHTVTDVIPVTKEFLSALAGEGAIFNSNSYWYGSKIGRNAMGKAVLQGDGKFLDKAAQLANSDLLWDEVLEIRNLGKTDLYVYDLSVPGFENFVCENVVAHNTPELRLPHPHWVPEVARTAISATDGKKMGEVDMFDLLRESLRQRPDYIIVGEVRGKEAYVLFQQMASGHPGMSTIHADSISKLVDRLTTPPISLPGNLIQNLDILIFSDTTSFKNKNVRKIDTIMEMLGYENGAPVGNVLFKWDPVKNYLRVVGKSAILKKIAYSSNMSEKAVREEILNRVKVLEWMQERGINDFTSVARIFSMYNSDPEKVLNAIGQ